ncbi:hypothetical protein HQ531_03705 [bacterium]|nr:hypothetical protein [bacterium]
MKKGKIGLTNRNGLYLLLLATGISCLINTSSIHAAPQMDEKLDGIGTIAYISDMDNRDAIFIQDGNGIGTIFQCSVENELILTPQVTADGKIMTFAVDNGKNQRSIHLLAPTLNDNGSWTAIDSTIRIVRGGAWPIYGALGEIYLAMPDPENENPQGVTDIYGIYQGRLTRISENLGYSKHVWPLMAPDGKKIMYRVILTQAPPMENMPVISSILHDLNSGARTMHLVNQDVFVEQWANNGKILYSFKLNDGKETRAYALYNPDTRESEEIYRNNSRQARLSPDSKYLATIRYFPEGSHQFDIFITDLQNKSEFNLTNTPTQSESLIGWIK